MIWLGVAIGIFVASFVWLLILGLCLSSRERDEREQLGYRELYVDSMPPELPEWINGPRDAA